MSGGSPAQDVDTILDLLRGRGGRSTAARRMIVTALLESGGHVSAEEITARIQVSHPDIHLTTTYRTLEALEELGVVDHVHMGHGRALYHLAGEPHQHLLCETCGRVVEVPDDVFADLARRVRNEYDFTIRPRHFAVLGTCRSCAATG